MGWTRDAYRWTQRSVGDETIRDGRRTRANDPATDEPQPNHLVLPASKRVRKLRLQVGDSVVRDGECYQGEEFLKPGLLHVHIINLAKMLAISSLHPFRSPAIISAHTIRSISLLLLSIQIFSSNPFPTPSSSSLPILLPITISSGCHIPSPMATAIKAINALPVTSHPSKPRALPTHPEI